MTSSIGNVPPVWEQQFVSILARATPGLMSRSKFVAQLAWLPLLCTLVACGGGDDSPASHSADVVLSSTLAYVVSACRENSRDGLFFRQEVRTQQGEREPTTAVRIPEIGPAQSIGVCRLYGSERAGTTALAFGAIQRFGVSPDGAAVVFEVSDQFSALGQFLRPEQKGFFVMRPDGTGLRKIAPASRQPTLGTASLVPLAFSPDSQRVVFPDRGPGPNSEEAVQIVTVELGTGERTQVTHLPPAPYLTFDFPGLYAPVFVDNETVAFASASNPNDLNPENQLTGFTVRVDGSQLKVIPSPIVQAGSQIIPTFVITGDRPTAITFRDQTDLTTELFLVDDMNLLQLTTYHRDDTALGVRGGGAFLGLDGEHVFFTASANPLASNPTENCQIFSIDRTGANLQQLTSFFEGEHSRNGCRTGRKPLGCVHRLLGQDKRSGALVFRSSCEPFAGRNPDGSQLFVMNPSGAGLRQLTDLRGLVVESDGTVTAELPGPYAYAQTF